MTPCRAAVLVCLLLAGLLTGPPSARATEDTDWALVLSTLHRQEEVVRSRLEDFKKRHAGDAARQDEALEGLLRDRARLALWQSTATDPWEITDVIAGFNHLGVEVNRLAQQPEQAWANLEQNAAILDVYRDRLTEIMQQEVPERFRQELAPTREVIESLGASIAAERDALAKHTAPLRELAKQIEKAGQSLQASLIPAWKIYYVTAFPSPFSVSYGLLLSQDLEDWELTANLCLALLQTNHNREMLLRALPAALAAGLLAAALGTIVILVGRRKGLPQTSRHTLAKAAVCVATGAMLVLLARRSPFFLYSPLSAAGEILLTAALVHISRLGRRPGDPTSPQTPILWPTWRLFGLGLIFEALRVPESLLSPVLCLILLFAARSFYKRHKATPPQQEINRVLAKTLVCLLPVLAGLSLAGLPQTSILCASALFYVALALRFAAATTYILGNREIMRHRGRMPILLGILAGAGFPFFFLAYLFLFLWLLSSQFGGENVFLELFTTETRIESVGISLQKLALLLGGYYGLRACVAVSAAFIRDLASRRQSLERGARTSLLTINTYVWWGIYLVYAMSVLGLSLTSVAVVAGGLSVGIGFGMQTMVNNFISGLILLFGRSVQAGDTIQIGDSLGTVKEVNIRNTEVLTKDNATIFVPNAELISGKIINWSHKDPSVRRDIAVGVAYGSDTDRVRRMLLAAAASCPAVLADPVPTVLHWDFGASTLDFRLRVWLADVDGAVTAMSEIRSAIDRLFREAGIEIAFPQADLHLRTAPALEELLQKPLADIRRRLDALERTAGQRPEDKAGF